MGCLLKESGTDEAECSRKAASRERVAGAVRSLILQLECAIVLHQFLLVTVLTYGNEEMIWREKKGSRIWGLEMDNPKG